jgi:hypothetical protein
MNRSQPLVLLIGLTLACGTVIAQTKEEHEAHHPEAKATAPAASDTDTRAEGEGMGMMKSMQQNMQKMHELMERIHNTNDPQEKAKLLKEHMHAMLDQMKSMGGSGGGMMTAMMENGTGQGTKKDAPSKAMMMCGDKKGMKSGEMMMQCHRMMHARLGMLQEMMGQILEHEEAEQQLERGE